MKTNLSFLVAGLFLTCLLHQTATGQTPQPLQAAYDPGSFKVSYVRVWEATAPETNPNVLMMRPLNDVKQSTQYFDGIGRPIQTVIKQGSLQTATGNNTDLITPIIYDQQGRVQFQYLTFGSTASDASKNDGSFKYDPFQEQASFYNTQLAGQSGETNIGSSNLNWAYSKTNFELSPLNRVLETYSPGASWVGSESAAVPHPVKLNYWNNTSVDNVKIWTVTNPVAFGGFGSYAIDQNNNGGIYPAGSLSKNSSIDENGNQVIEFKDIEGRMILKKVQLLDRVGEIAVKDDGTGRGYEGWLSTYYIYDDLGQLRCVIQPNAVSSMSRSGNWDITPFLGEQCFRYEYDYRSRMIMKKVPGAQEVSLVYDNRDRLVYTQDGNMKEKNWWTVTIYDELDRPTVTGILVYGGSVSELRSFAANQDFSTSSPVSIQSSARLVISSRNTGKPLYQASESIEFVDGFSTVNEPSVDFTAEIVPASTLSTNTAAPGNLTGIGTSFTALTQTSYDSYPAGIQQYNSANFAKLDAGSNPYAEFPPGIRSDLTKGMVTLNKVWTLEDANDLSKGRWLQSINYYDDKGRTIQVQSDNYSGGKDEFTNLYDFSGKVLCTYQTHNNPGSAIGGVSVRTSMQYDALGRLLSIKKQVNDLESLTKTIVQNEYDALGQLKRKTLGSSLEDLNYEYNVRGWLLGLNRNYITNSTNTNKFAFDLAYDKPTAVVSSQSYSPEYNGNIAGTIWKSAGDQETRRYDFTYDKVSRLLSADFNQFNSGSFTKNALVDFSVSNLSYDDNGNISTQSQKGFKPNGAALIDQLRYNYYSNSNKLKSVVDFSNLETSTLGDFKTLSSHPQSALKSSLTPTSTASDFDPVMDYTYDENGNLSQDRNKNISSVTYNYLNLPYKIEIPGKGTIIYTYDAAGNKLEKSVQDQTDPQNPNKVTRTTYIGGFVYQDDTLQYFSHEEGRIRCVKVTNPNFTSTNSFVFDYFIKDHLGNVRMVLTDEQKLDQYPTLSFEGASGSEEVNNQNKYWENKDGQPINVEAVRKQVDFGGQTTNCMLVREDHNTYNNIGPTKLLKVMASDRIHLKMDYYYPNATSTTNSNDGFAIWEITLGSLLNSFSASPAVNGLLKAGGTDPVRSQLNQDLSFSNFINPSMAYVSSDPNTGLPIPKAYLNLVFFNDQFQFDRQSSRSFPIQYSSTGKGTINATLSNAVAAGKNGYVYIYFTNQSNELVYVDNFMLSHERGPIVEENHYYPFGLTMAGISSKAIAFGSPENKRHRFQNQEYNDDLGVDTYEFRWRMDDPQIGRFWQVDPLSEKYVHNSTYAFSENKVTTDVELEGLESVKFWDNPVEWVATLGEGWSKGQGGAYETMDAINRSVNPLVDAFQTVTGRDYAHWDQKVSRSESGMSLMMTVMAPEVKIEAGVVKLTTSAETAVIRNGSKLVNLDANALINGVEKGQASAIKKAIGQDKPYVSMTAAKEFLVKGNKSDLKTFMESIGARVGKNGASASQINSLQQAAVGIGRRVSSKDAAVIGSTINNNARLITNDKKLTNFARAVGIWVSSY